MSLRKSWYTMDLFSQLEDLDYACDIAHIYIYIYIYILHNSKSPTAERKTGLQINQKNTKIMEMNLTEHPQIKIEEEELEVVADFTYLGNNISVENSV